MPETVTMPRLQAGGAVRHRGIAVVPLFPYADPRAEYVTVDQALAAGLRVTEVSESGSVAELRVVNPTDHRVLLYDGQELVGAKQNRILDVSVLVDARSELTIPVSCVEQGRWSKRTEGFASAAHTSHPELRRRKAEVLAARPAQRGAAQGEVWDAVAAKADRLGSRSVTGAQSDTFASRAADLEGLAGRFPLHPGQCGAVLALRGAPVVLDAVSRPDAFAVLYPKLLAGYMLDAFEALDGPDTADDRIEAFVGGVTGAGAATRPGVGLGENFTASAPGLMATGVALEGEVLQVSAYATGTDAPTGDASTIARPRRRRVH